MNNRQRREQFRTKISDRHFSISTQLRREAVNRLKLPEPAAR